MRKILLTSTGFTNKRLERIFLNNIGKNPSKVKAIFVPTAANDKESKEMIPYCYQDLTDAGILPENIFTYNLDYLMSYSEISKYDVIYFCGGSDTYLINAINSIEFNKVLLKAVENGLFYIGVSAGSMIASTSVKNNLGIIPNPLEPHCEKNITPCGNLPLPGEPVNISDNQAVWILGNDIRIIE